MSGISVNAGMQNACRFTMLDRPPCLGCICPARAYLTPRARRVIMLEFSLWVLGGVLMVGLVACRLARKPRKQNDMELLEFDFDKSKCYEKDGRKFPFSY
jgi:hypothetical protein